MIIKNGKVIFLDKIERCDVRIAGGKITELALNLDDDEEIIDAEGLYISPGFIDVHIHGAGGYDAMDGNYDALNNISKTIARYGTTSFLPTTMTCSAMDIKKAVNSAAEAIKIGTKGANIIGVHLEGPFINPVMLGAQNLDFIQNPSIDEFENLAGDNISIIKEVTLAPELAGSEELIAYLVSKGIVVSIGHSNCTCDQAVRAFGFGVKHSTHLFNAMRGFHHREAGIVGAVFDNDVTTEMICDGIHLSYPVVRVVLKQKSTDKVLLITDAMMACGMKAGVYYLGGQKVLVDDFSARLQNGTLAGSILTLDKAVRNVYKNSQYKLYEVIKMVTYNPALHCGLQDRKGLMKAGYDADIVIFDEEINMKSVFIGGKKLE